MKRRKFLWITAAIVIGYPAISFIKKVQYRPPFSIKVYKTLSPGESVIFDDFVLFETESGPLAVSRHCSHLGCIVNYRENEKKFICPCHQSTFHWDGKYIKGPAQKDLGRYAVKRLNGDKGQGYEVLVPRSKLS